jgi:adenylate cyclase
MTLSEALRSLTRALVGDLVLTPAEVAREAEVDLERARRLWRALGFPPVPDDERAFSHSDAAILRAVRELVENGAVDPPVLVQLARVTGQSLARLAEAQIASRTILLETNGRRRSAADWTALVTGTEALIPNLEPLVGYAWRRHLLAAVCRLVATETESGRATRPVVAGFADLVGFTAMSQQLSARQLAAAVDRFEALAYEHIPERGGRVVKMIGDEVMFACDEPAAAAEIALALVEAYAGDDLLPEVRVGLAIGDALSWEGDLYGPTVNLAGRLVNIARPGTVLVSQKLAEGLEGAVAFDLRPLRPLALKGMGRVRVWVLRRGGTGAEKRAGKRQGAAASSNRGARGRGGRRD